MRTYLSKEEEVGEESPELVLLDDEVSVEVYGQGGDDLHEREKDMADAITSCQVP